MTKQPMQGFKRDKTGVIRFRENAVVRQLLDWAHARGFGLNEIAELPFSEEDRQQFAQLIGYSLSGYHELPYVTDAAALEASKAARKQGFERARGCRDGDGCPVHSRPGRARQKSAK